MTIDYEKVNNVYDVAFTIGLSIFFMAFSLILNNVMMKIVSFPFGIWIFSLWIREWIDHNNEKTAIFEEDCEEFSDDNDMESCLGSQTMISA